MIFDIFFIFLLCIFFFEIFVSCRGLTSSKICAGDFPTDNIDAEIGYYKCSNNICLICHENKTLSQLSWINEITKEEIAKETFFVSTKENGTLNDCHRSFYSLRLYQPCGRRRHGNYTCRHSNNILQTYLLKEGES